MGSPQVLDFEKLLAPLSEDQPSGSELKEDPSPTGLYYQIKGAREAARAAERQLAQALLYGDRDEVARIAPPDWKLVKRLAEEVLATRSKDLWVAAWLIEALTRLHGFAGVRDGFRLARELVEHYWDGIHPQPDEDGYLTTVAQLTGLNGDDAEGALIGPIESIPLTAGTTHGALTSRDYRQATKAGGDGAITLDTFQRAAAETPPEFFQLLREDVDQSLEEFVRLSAALEEHCGEDEHGYSAAPPSSNIRSTLEECRERVRWLAGEPAESESPADQDAAAAAGGQAPGAGPGIGAGPVATRDEAFRTLLQLAEFFRRTEPHSPVSYALEQAVRWGRMALPELMAELISEESTREDLFRRVGIPKPDSSD